MEKNEETRKRLKAKIELADDLPTPSVNPIYFAMQILITVIVVITFQKVIKIYKFRSKSIKFLCF